MRTRYLYIIITALCFATVIVLVIGLNYEKQQNTLPENKQILVGAVLPLTGDGAQYGIDAKRGLDLAAKLWNAAQVDILYEDDEMSPAKATLAFEKITQTKKPIAVIGGISSSTALAIAPISLKREVVFFSPTASNPKLTNSGSFFMRNWPSDSYEALTMADYILKNTNIKNMGILYINNDFGLTLSNLFKDNFEDMGGKVLYMEAYSPGSVNFRTELTKFKNHGVSGIYLPGYYQEVSRILKQAKEIGLSTKFFGVSSCEDPKLIELSLGASEGFIYTRPKFDPKKPSSKYAFFSRAFNEKYSSNPGLAAAQSFDALNIILLANSRSETKGTKLHEEIIKIKEYSGVTGLTSFDDNGDVIKEMAIFKVKDGEFSKIED